MRLSLTQMVRKRSEVCMLLLYVNKEKKCNCLLKTKKGGGAYIIVSNQALHFKYVSID